MIEQVLRFKEKTITIVMLLLVFSVSAQDDLSTVKQSTNSYNTLRASQLNAHRAFTKSRNPLKLISNSVLWVYQRIFSEQIMAECGFETSCSAFAKQAIGERGVFTGVLLAVDRLTRCNGVAQPESENYLVNKKTGKLRDEPGMYKIGK